MGLVMKIFLSALFICYIVTAVICLFNVLVYYDLLSKEEK
jgi:hypothetical protein